MVGVGIVMGYRLDDQSKIIIFSTMSRPALGPAQPAVQCVPVAISLRLHRPGREADHSHLSSVEVKNGGAVPLLPLMSLSHNA
jgi:hypothetical protein